MKEKGLPLSEMVNVAKPKVDEVYRLLARHGALVVHFSGAKGSEARPERWFPSDLRTVIEGRAAGGISCSTVTGKDTYDSSWGSIGVIVGMADSQSLIAAHPHDCGSREEIVNDQITRIVERERDLSPVDLEKTIVERDGYNEWVMRNTPILGIFVQAPCVAEDKQGDPRKFSLEELASLFPGLQIYTFINSQIVRLVPPPPEEVSHADIYRAP
jgi:hypothetical protein